MLKLVIYCIFSVTIREDTSKTGRAGKFLVVLLKKRGREREASSNRYESGVSPLNILV